ncbi:sterile alpha motif domain-containing protein 9-like [Betta splendens]|uniref:Sterile alpha motif domain-containing protein 9-like n=1 Tax=Betta splendens TaxID=158456 RepID=A0A6P7LGH6_BETSP|nr:sterile alpha motif domain-containing protein 9-like [Betta splendens]
MANGPGLSTANGGEVYVGSEIQDSPALLDVLYANHFEGQRFAPELIKQTEENFYRGAPPLWLNFHISEQAESDGTRTPLIKRDGYDTLKQQIKQKKNHPGISTVKLFHQPGCGGTTLAMQVLWDLRKTFRCAVLEDSTSDMKSVAKAVVQLFTAGSRDVQNTVLLLLNNEQILDHLEESIKEVIAEQRVVPKMPVLVLFCCVRKNAVRQVNYVFLEKSLSGREMKKFNEKKNELSQQYPNRHQQFHGFNILQTNFSKDYAREVSTVFTKLLNAKRKLRSQLAAFLALLNTYVPGSYLMESQCLEFFQHYDSNHKGTYLQTRMKPFSDLIVTFTQNTSPKKLVRLANPIIAEQCVEVMAEEGVTRSGTARNFITYFCRAGVPPFLLDFIKVMLTKREEKEEGEGEEEHEIKEKRFSRLILDILKFEGKPISAKVLEVAAKKIAYPNGKKNLFFPQALARLYYIEIKNYIQAERWAKEAKKRDPGNSFIADTLGQVYKNHLKNRARESTATQREILKLATKAIKAFKDAELLAESESGTDMKADGVQVSHFYNARCQFGYLQVCIILYYSLVDQNEIWEEVLTKKVPLGSVLRSLGDNKLFRFKKLIEQLRDDVKEKCEFLNTFLTYSKPSLQKKDPSDCQRTVTTCYRIYVERPEPDLVMEIKDKLRDDNEEAAEDAESPESCLAAVLKEWSMDNQDNSPNLKPLIQKTKHSYEAAFGKYFRSRYLCPLFYLGREIVPANTIHGLVENQDKTEKFINYMINKDRIFRDVRVQQQLFKCEGRVENYRIITNVGGCDIRMKANMQESTWVPRQVSFYIGFTISGPVAFGIQTKPDGRPSTREASNSPENTRPWVKVKPKDTTRSNVKTYSLQCEAGRFQCTVSDLRWVCSRKVSFAYQFKSWEDHEQKLKEVCYNPGGPLLEIKVTDGKFDDVYLPYWICATSEKFAVLHSKKNGTFLEQVSEVGPSHVRLFHPSFTTNGVIIKEDVVVRAKDKKDNVHTLERSTK